MNSTYNNIFKKSKFWKKGKTKKKIKKWKHNEGLITLNINWYPLKYFPGMTGSEKLQNILNGVIIWVVNATTNKPKEIPFEPNIFSLSIINSIYAEISKKKFQKRWQKMQSIFQVKFFS